MKIRYLIIQFCLVFGVKSLHASCDAKHYNQSNQSQFEHAVKEMPKLQLSGNETVLDIGSGDGFLSLYIAKKYLENGNLVGIDKSSDMVAFADLHNTHSLVNYQCADICEYAVSAVYDAVISFWTLHWVDQYEKAVENIARLLKPGGKALLAHGVGSPLLRTIALHLLDTEKWLPYKKHAALLTYPELSTVALAIEKSGLRIEHLEVKTNGIWMERSKIIKNWVSLSMFDFIPVSMREQFCNEILNEFERYYPANESDEIWRCSTVVVMLLSKN